MTKLTRASSSFWVSSGADEHHEIVLSQEEDDGWLQVSLLLPPASGANGSWIHLIFLPIPYSHTIKNMWMAHAILTLMIFAARSLQDSRNGDAAGMKRMVKCGDEGGKKLWTTGPIARMASSKHAILIDEKTGQGWLVG